MPVLSNLPGAVVIKEDGNLMVLEGVPGDVTVIVGTAPDGPLDTLYLVRQTSDAEAIFDKTGSRSGTLLRGMYEALDAGSRYVALLRIGASPAILKVNGFTIHTKDANLQSASNFKINYQYAAGEHILRIYTADTNEEVYNSLTGKDTGAVVVYFDETKVNTLEETTPFAIGAVNAGVLMNEVVTPIAVLPGASFVALAETILVNAVDPQVFAGSIIQVKTTTTVTTDDGVEDPVVVVEDTTADYLISYVHEGTAYIAKKFVDGLEVEFSGFATGNVVAPVIEGDVTTEVVNVIQLVPSFKDASLGISLSLNEKYEALERAYWMLESAKIDMIVPMDVALDAPNLVNNINVAEIPAEADYLGKAYKFEHNGDLFFMWETGLDGVADIVPSPEALGIDGLQARKLLGGAHTIESVLNDTAAPESDIEFFEVNFGHQVATFCHNLSVNDNECLSTISMRNPKNYSKAEITRWIGKEPTVTAGAITVSGTGILGYKFVKGSTGQKAGFFATTNGLVGGVAEVNPLTGKVDDIGKYLSIVAMPLIHRGTFSVTASGYLTYAAANYAGMVMGLDAKESPLHKKVPGRVGLPFALKNVDLNKLASRYVVYSTNSEGNVIVVDSPTAALPESDYKELLTVRCANTAIEVARAISEPFFGNLYDGSIRNSLEEQVNGALHTLKTLKYIQKGVAKVRATRDQEIKGEGVMRLELVTPGTFKRLFMFVALKK